MSKLTKIALAFMVLSTSQLVFANKQDVLTPLEIADPDLPGGSYDMRIEKQKKVDQLKELVLEPGQVRDVKEILLQQQRATISPYSSVATPATRSLNVKFSPGVIPPVIRLSANMLTTIVFTDAAGNPWNINNVSMNRVLFSDGLLPSNAAQPQENPADNPERSGKNILSLEPLNPVAYGNVAITLDGLDTPVIFILSTGQTEVDLRVDARIPGLNPHRVAKSAFTASNTTTHSLDDTTLLFVDGSPPQDAVSLKTSSREIDAWLFNDEVVIRTDAQVIYPAFKSSVTSASGMTVYRFEKEVKAFTVSKGTSSKNIFIEME